MSAQGGVRAASGAHGVTHVDAAPILALVDAWLAGHAEHDRPGALSGVSAALGLQDDSLRRRLARMRSDALVAFEFADALLTATDQQHEWQHERKGGVCRNPAGRESAYCWAHDPERETERVEIVTRARQSIRGRAVA